MIKRYVPSKLEDYSMDEKTGIATLYYDEGMTEPHYSDPLPLIVKDYEELKASYFSSLSFWLKAERR